jgi:hypothetical protein
MIEGVAQVPRRALTRRAVGLWAHVRRRRLDAALAAGADPWSAADLMVRASRLSSLSERREIAAALEALLALAEQDRAVSPRLRGRRRRVWPTPLLAAAAPSEAVANASEKALRPLRAPATLVGPVVCSRCSRQARA